MKAIIHFTILFVATCSCNVEPNPTSRPSSAYSSEEMAKQVITALQHVSAQEYIALFPRLDEFHQVMDKNSVLYGESLSAAKEEFDSTYKNDLIIAVKESFNRVIREGSEKGISWSTIVFERVESSESKEEQFGQGQVSIVFSANGTTHRLFVKKAVIMNAQWKVSQFIELV